MRNQYQLFNNPQNGCQRACNMFNMVYPLVVGIVSLGAGILNASYGMLATGVASLAPSIALIFIGIYFIINGAINLRNICTSEAELGESIKINT